jgi:energy-coupling factor transporter ATP-binding protein EcfA2
VANATYDVFVSYSRADGPHAAEIDSVLRVKGLKTFFDRRNLQPGLPWVRGLEQAIAGAKAAIVLIGPRGLGNTQQYERDLALIRQTRDPAFPVVPVMLPETTSDPPFDFLRVLTWIDFSHVAKVSDAPDVLEQLLAALQGGQASVDAMREAICPYRGLDAFREEDSAFFFGRGSPNDPKTAIGELVCKVRDHSFVMVVGRSGSGKSSLVYAGLMPALRRDRDKFWNVLSLRPGPAPLRALAAAFNPRKDEEGAAEYATKITKEADNLRTGDLELLSHMIRQELDRAEGRPDRLLLYIDQWEELYAQVPPGSDTDRAAQHTADVNRFIDLLLTAARTAPVAVVATIRADFYDPLIGHQEIKKLLPTGQVLLGKMLRSELEQTIVEPARKVGLAFDPLSLVQQISDEAGEDEGMLPLLQYALKETWAMRRGNTITADSYTRSGGVREAIRITAERTFDALSSADQQAARQLFLRLVTPGEGQEDTRARAAMPVDEAQRKIVEQFAAQRTRLLVTGFDRAARPTVEVAHEALIRTWPRLRSWIDANREKLRSRAAILQAKAEWEHQGRREDLLLPAGFQLERARALLADPGDITTDDIKEFVSLSSARQETERKEKENRLAREQERHGRERRVRFAAIAAAFGAMAFIALLGWTAYSVTFNILLMLQSEKAEAIAQRIDLFINELVGQVNWTTRFVTLGQNRSDYSFLLQQVPAIDRLVRLDASGREQLRLTRSEAVIGSLIDYSQNARFRATVGKGLWISPAYHDGSELFMTIGMEHWGSNAGLTIAEVKLSLLSDLMTIGQIGKAGSVYVLNDRGRVLKHSDPSVIPGKTDMTNLPQVAAARGAMPVVSIGRDLKDNRVLTAVAPVPRMKWLVFVEQPLYDALATPYDLMIRLASLVGAAVVAVICFLLLRRTRLFGTRGQLAR